MHAQPPLWYEGSGTTDWRYFLADELGSIVDISGNSGAGLATFKYSPDGESANGANSVFRRLATISRARFLTVRRRFRICR